MTLNYIFNNMEHQALVTLAMVCVIVTNPLVLHASPKVMSR